MQGDKPKGQLGLGGRTHSAWGGTSDRCWRNKQDNGMIKQCRGAMNRTVRTRRERKNRQECQDSQKGRVSQCTSSGTDRTIKTGEDRQEIQDSRVGRLPGQAERTGKSGPARELFLFLLTIRQSGYTL